MKFNLPPQIKYVLNTLIKNGHDAYIVGGCVRDLLCGKEPCDYDVTTSALPEQVQKIFEKTVETGLKHGTVTVIVENFSIEVTTFRTESLYNDNRHPENVTFVGDVKDDLARRDFTVNAMCYNDKKGLIDLFDGKHDINNNILRAVGNAESRFCEDALRILRLFRFAATLDFDIEKNTFDAAIKCAPLLASISAERIFNELKKASCGNKISLISPLLETNALQNYSLKNADLSRLYKLPKRTALRAFAFLFLTSFNLQKTLDNFKCSNNFKDYCLKMASLVTDGINCDKISIKKALRFADFDTVCDCLEYIQSILNIDTANHKTLLKEIIDANEPYKISQLDISGNDMKALGFDGKQVGEKLEFLLQQVLKNPLLNKREKLLNLICN